MSICRVIPCVFGKGCLLWPVCSLDNTLLTFALLRFVLQGQTYLLFGKLLDSCCALQPLWWKGHLFLVLVLKGLIDLELVNFSYFDTSGWVIDLNYCETEWFVLKMKWDHSVIIDIAPKYFISNTFVIFEDYYISSKRFLPMVVDRMII